MRILTLILSLVVVQNFAQPKSTVDNIFDKNIKSVQFYVDNNSQNSEITYPILPMYSDGKLMLEFDELGDAMSNFTATIHNCTWDWKISAVSDLDYLEEYNEFRISEMERSIATKINYTHYSFELPSILRSGNYIIILKNDDFPEKRIMTKRFSIYQNGGVSVEKNSHSSFQNSKSDKQIVNFDIQLSDEILSNTFNGLKVVIRQNGRWNKLLVASQPTFIDLSKGVYSYQFINDEELFDAGNEFRVFDSRSASLGGIGIAHSNFTSDTNTMILITDEDRSYHTPYQKEDINGQFIIASYEYDEGDIQGDYIQTTFTLKTYPREGDVYLNGAFCNWKPIYKLEYNYKTSTYTGTFLIKQGYYNYSYIIKNKGTIDEYQFEGSFTQTINNYDILVYYKKPGQFSEELTGYQLFELRKN